MLIPNASFVSDKVKNWTLRNNVRRVTISIGTAYANNPRQVREVLLKVARDYPDVLRTPEPFVDLREFGASSINFMLYVFVDDISKTASVRTELSMAIFDAFAEAGIEIPFTQTDVNIRNIDRLRELVADHVEQQPEARLPHVPAKHGPTGSLGLDPRVESGSPRRTVVRQGEPLFAGKDMRQTWNLRRFPFIWDHSVIQVHVVNRYERETP